VTEKVMLACVHRIDQGFCLRDDLRRRSARVVADFTATPGNKAPRVRPGVAHPAFGGVFAGAACVCRLASSFLDAPNEAEAVRQEFMDLFKVPLGRYVPPYEAVHRDSRLVDGVPTRGLLMGPSSVDVRRLYQAAGADLRLPELPDHIGVELAFLAFLCEEEEAARSAGDDAAADNYRAYQRGFLTEHVLEWVPSYCEIVHQHATTSYFRALTKITPSRPVDPPG
jgi:TorA maturation chaperone TorD